MRIAFLVNRVDELSVEMSTVKLIHAAAARGHDVFVGGVRDLSLASDDAVWLRGRPASSGDLGEPWLGALRGARTEPVPLDAVGLLWLRTNPARDPANATAHRAALALAEMLSARGSWC